jgi:hypothetical protein
MFARKLSKKKFKKRKYGGNPPLGSLGKKYRQPKTLVMA